MKRAFHFFIALAFCCLFCFPVCAKVEDEKETFVLYPIYPKTQRANTMGYYNIKISPGEQQELTVAVKNLSKQEIRISVAALDPATGKDGMIDYSRTGPANASRQHAFSSLAHVLPEPMAIPPNAEVDIVTTLQIPDSPFEGCVLGSLLFTQEPDDADASTPSSYRYASIVPVLLSEEAELPPPNFELETVAFSAPEEGAKTRRLSIPVHNTVSTLATGVQVQVTVTQDAETVPCAEATFMDVEMAPNTIFPLEIALPDDGAIPEVYKVSVQILYQEKEWNLQKELLLPANTQALSSASEAEQEKRSFPTWGRVSIVIVLLTLLIFGLRTGLRLYREDQLYVAMMQQKLIQQMKEKGAPFPSERDKPPDSERGADPPPQDPI